MLRSSARLTLSIGLLGLLCAVASVAHARPRALTVACAQKRSGLLRYVTSAAGCHRRSERVVDFAKDGPVHACIRRNLTPVVNAQFLSNEISGSSGPGLSVLTGDSNGTTRVRLSGNVIGEPGMRIDAGSTGSATYNPTLCADIGANLAPGILLNKRSPLAATYRFGLPGLTPDPATAPAVEAYVAANNLATATVGSGDLFSACTLPF